MWYFIILCTIIGFTSETNGTFQYDDENISNEGKVIYELPEGEERAPSEVNEGILVYEKPDSEERVRRASNYGKMHMVDSP